MTNILDHVSPTPVLEVDVWPRSATRKGWFAITKRIIQDTIADNASCGLFVLGDNAVSPRDVDLVTCGMVVEKNGSIISTGAGAAALSSPVNCVAWLANTLGEFGISLKAGEVILSGSLVPLEPVKAGDTMCVDIGGIGSASVRFV